VISDTEKSEMAMTAALLSPKSLPSKEPLPERIGVSGFGRPAGGQKRVGR